MKKQITISVHNGTKVSRAHNMRNRKVTDKEPHIDKNGWYAIWHDEPLRDAYKRLFGKAQEEYNLKQTRNDRRIVDYLSTVQKSAKQHAVYETIITLGNVDEHPEPHESYEILQQVYGEWRMNYPNLAVVGAYFHADEKGAPHIHIDYVPIAHGYKKGLAVQNGLVKAFGEMGFILKGKDTAQIQWQRDLKSRVTELAKERGFKVVEPTVKRKKHVETALYKLEKQVPALRKERNKLYGDVARAQESLYEAEKPFREIEHLEHRLEAVESKYEALRDFVAGYNCKGVNLLERFDHEEAEKASHEKRTRRKTNNSKDEMER
nr:unnamed protein product [uncultured bacterium]